MESVYNHLSKEINIDKERQAYTQLYDLVRKTILDGLKRNPEFKKLFSNEKICGSYPDNLKVSKPNEFDLVIRLEFPSKDYVHIYADNDNKGNVFIDLTDVLASLRRTINWENDMYIFLSRLIDGKGLLLENKFQQWLQSLMTNVLQTINYLIVYQNETFELKYRREGPAHTIVVRNVRESEPLFSVDFVPGFVFPVSKCVAKRLPNSIYWEAIPRPLKKFPVSKCVAKRLPNSTYCEAKSLKSSHNGGNNNPSFRTSYTDAERLLIAGKNQLKNALRLVKKYRDLRPNMKHLKSYYIKTIFLWMNEEHSADFWNRPISQIMLEVFERLEECLTKGVIKFFWDDELNLLQTLKKTQIIEMLHEVQRSRKTLEKASEKDILNLFLSKDEQTGITKREMKDLADNLEEIEKPKNTIKGKFFYCVAATVGILLGLRLFNAAKGDLKSILNPVLTQKWILAK